MRLSIHAISNAKTAITPSAANAAEVEALLPEGWRHIAFCDKASGAVLACWQYARGHEPAKWELERALAALGRASDNTTIGAAGDNPILVNISSR